MDIIPTSKCFCNLLGKVINDYNKRQEVVSASIEKILKMGPEENIGIRKVKISFIVHGALYVLAPYFSIYIFFLPH